MFAEARGDGGAIIRDNKKQWRDIYCTISLFFNEDIHHVEIFMGCIRYSYYMYSIIL